MCTTEVDEKHIISNFYSCFGEHISSEKNATKRAKVANTSEIARDKRFHLYNLVGWEGIDDTELLIKFYNFLNQSKLSRCNACLVKFCIIIATLARHQLERRVSGLRYNYYTIFFGLFL